MNMNQKLTKTRSNHDESNLNHTISTELKRIKAVSNNYCVGSSNWCSTVFHGFATLAETYIMDSCPLISLELLLAITVRLFHHMHELLTPFDRDMGIKEETITDSELVKAGDILLTPDLKHVIVKEVRAIITNNQSDIIRLEVVHAANRFLLSKRVLQSTFALLPKKSIVEVFKRENQYDKENTITDAALRNVGNIFFPGSRECFELLPVCKN